MKDLRDAAVIDYESLPIHKRPRYPPLPVGVALRIPGQRKRYYAFGHPSGNTHTWEQARAVLGEIYDSGRPLLFHNAKFDVDVGETHLGLPRLPWSRYHDTQPQLFLKDPRSETFSLKQSAKAILGEKPDERDAVIDWLIATQPIPGVKLGDKPKGKNYAGAYIGYAPVRLVGPYAVGDVDRTAALCHAVLPELDQRGMRQAYEREARMLPITMEMERNGIRIDLERAGRDEYTYTKILARIDDWLRKRLRAPALDPDSPAELGRALVKARVAKLNTTPKSKPDNPQYQVNKDELKEAIKDPQVLGVLLYRAQLCTCLRTFMRPWIAVAEQTGGYIYTSWNSTRQDRGGEQFGARTGRFSSTPNFQNMPKNEFSIFFKHHEPDRKKKLKLPVAPFDLPELPECRSYIIPYLDGERLFGRDYSQQELRILAHFDGDVMMRAYLDDPWLDHHQHARELINQMLSATWERKPVKNFGLGMIYGMGIGKLADKAETTVELARVLKRGYLAIFPGLRAMYDDMKIRANEGRPIRTWGGREYYCEEPRWVDGHLQKYDYKLLNVLIQGSAADMTKEALIRYHDVMGKDVHLLLTAHDEILASCPPDSMKREMKKMQEAMESIECDVAMLTEGAWSPKNWASMRDYDKRGVLKYRGS